MQELDAVVGIGHDGHGFSAQRIARLTARLEDVTLPVERQHQVLEEFAAVVNGAAPRQAGHPSRPPPSRPTAKPPLCMAADIANLPEPDIAELLLHNNI